MKNLFKSFITILIVGSLVTGCDKMLDVNSERVVSPDEYNMTATNDSIYSIIGIFSQLQNIVDSYVLLGELRGDLMDVDSKANLYLKEINNFEVSPDNPYAANIHDYYSIVNNCNYIISKNAESKYEGYEKFTAACKTIRAWTYMQIALNFGSAVYYDEPILSVSQAEAIQARQPIGFDELAPILINELTPIKDVLTPDFDFVINSHTFNNSFFPVKFVLGDLYLWTGQYQKAAQEYKDLIYKNSYTILNNRYETNRTVTNNAFSGGITMYGGGWLNLFSTGSAEYITNIATTNEYDYKFQLDSLMLNAELVSSEVAQNNWRNQMYYQSATLDTLGDLRIIGSVSKQKPERTTSGSGTVLYHNLKDFSDMKYITKYAQMNLLTTSVKNTSKIIMIYRVALLYPRYTEAINRAGNPNMAFAVLKYGLSKTTLENKAYIPYYEVDSVNIPDYLNFKDRRFDNNIGIRMRGCGNVNLDTIYYIIPKLTTKQDSIEFVEDKIQQELALETAFEGNRFQDLMRFAIRRNDNAYLADKVASKHTANKEAIRNKLMTRENWYIRK